MKLKDILKDIPVTASSVSGDTEIRDICYDSRQVQPGDLFVAVVGLASDGHKFIPMALEKGAAAVLCQQAPETDGPYVTTPDSRKALALASAAYFGHPADKLCMVGVTGTNGKTTSTILIKHLLEDSLGAKVGLVGTISNWIGDQELHTERTTPESYELQKLLHEMVEAGCTHGVMEVSSHALMLDRVEGIRFQVGLFTNLTQDHLDFHKTMEAYGEAKSRLFSICDKGAVNLDDPWADFMLQRAQCPMIGFGLDNHQGQLYAQDVTYTASGVTFTAVEQGQSAQIHLAIPGRFSVSNALTVLAAARLLDIPLEAAAQSLSRAKGVKGRVEVVPTGSDFTMIIDYAHTPDALEKVLQALRAVTQGRLVALFGCGGDRDGTKRPIMGRIAAENADFSIVTSDNPRTEDPETIISQIVAGMPSDAPKTVIVDRPTAIAWAIDHHQPGDVILLAGKGHETYQDIGGAKHHMDEREIVAQHLHRDGRV
jgi:UDP-N-acetylmuramoyl-L-alanyl-D-glutamate--2,6-diaminopimelate ligase